MRNCETLVSFLPIDACDNKPKSALQQCIVDFYTCQESIEDKVKKLRSKGFFGLMDQSNCAANDINDIHYLLHYLTSMFLEKYQDATYNCTCCRYSKHPMYYIEKYNLCCIYEYFKCKGIDISCYLKAFHVENVFEITGFTLDPLMGQSYAYSVNYLNGDDFDICVSPITIDTTTDLPSECCTDDGDAPSEQASTNNMLTNGDFVTDLSSWGHTPDFMWDNGSAYLGDVSSTPQSIKQAVDFVIGKNYKLCFELSGLVDCTVNVEIGTMLTEVGINAAGEYCFEFVADETNTLDVKFSFIKDGGEIVFSGKLDNVVLENTDCCIDSVTNTDCLWLYNHLKALE